MSEDLGRQRNDLHEFLPPQFPGHRPEDAGADRLALGVDQDRGVAIKLDIGPIVTPHALDRPHHHRLDHLSLLDAALGDGFFDRDANHVADGRVTAFGSAEHVETDDVFGARIVGDVQHGIDLDHGAADPGSALTSASARSTIEATRQRLRLDSGRVSTRRTTSPIPQPRSSWAMYRVLRRTTFLYCGWMMVHSTATTTVFCILLLTTRPTTAFGPVGASAVARGVRLVLGGVLSIVTWRRRALFHGPRF